MMMMIIMMWRWWWWWGPNLWQKMMMVRYWSFLHLWPPPTGAPSDGCVDIDVLSMIPIAHCWCSLLRSSLCFCGCLWLERLPRWCLWRLRLQRQHGDDEDDLDDYVYDFADHDDHKDLCHQNDDDYQVPLPRWWTMPSPLSDTELTQLRATFGWWVFVTVIIKMNYYDPDQNHKHQLHSWPCLLTAVIVMFKPFWLGMAMFLYLLMRIDSRIFPHRCASTASKSIKEINFFWPKYCDSGVSFSIPEDGQQW